MKSVYSKHYQKFLQRLKKAREEAGMSQVDAAKKLRKPQSYVSKCEAGERRVDIVDLARFAKIYGKPVSFFEVEFD